jgi:glycosyltransferase involved in cell wall biosynthesis
VLRFIADPELRSKMGERGKSRVMEFDIGTSVDTVESTYRECLKSL